MLTGLELCCYITNIKIDIVTPGPKACANLDNSTEIAPARDRVLEEQNYINSIITIIAYGRRKIKETLANMLFSQRLSEFRAMSLPVFLVNSTEDESRRLRVSDVFDNFSNVFGDGATGQSAYPRFV